tara:strand:+ start:1794 stop:2540 length:747 start_codon:yes stop_codon:yes gene_type:complete
MRNQTFITSPKKGNNTKKKEFITAVLLGENYGYRMKSYGPISMLKLEDGKTVIEKQIESIQSTFQNFEIIVCVGFESIKIVNFLKTKFSNMNIKVVENQMYHNSNCCESIRLCLNTIMNDKIIFFGGGVLFCPSHLGMLNLNKPSIVTQNQIDDSNFEIGIIEEKSKLQRLSLGVKDKYWTEILYLNNVDLVDRFYKIVSTIEYKNKFMFEAINELCKKQDLYIQENVIDRPIRKIDNIKVLRKTTKL